MSLLFNSEALQLDCPGACQRNETAERQKTACSAGKEARHTAEGGSKQAPKVREDSHAKQTAAIIGKGEAQGRTSSGG